MLLPKECGGIIHVRLKWHKTPDKRGTPPMGGVPPP